MGLIKEGLVGSRVEFPVTLHNRWRKFAEDRGVTLASVLREALQEYLDAREAAVPPGDEFGQAPA